MTAGQRFGDDSKSRQPSLFPSVLEANALKGPGAISSASKPTTTETVNDDHRVVM
jgi:hypothetical protein